MARMNDWQRDIYEGLRREGWSLTGPNAIVKVLPLASTRTGIDGYIALAKHLFGKTPKQIETDLGFESDFLKTGATICRLARLPRLDEYEYELTAKYPGGLAHNPAHGDPRYPPGSEKVHQWRIKKGAEIPISGSIQLRPADRFPYNWTP
jgi:hypothetical protein